jgi:hypothetical protein
MDCLLIISSGFFCYREREIENKNIDRVREREWGESEWERDINLSQSCRS